MTTPDEVDPVYNIDDYASILKFKVQMTQREARESLLRIKASRVSKCNEKIPSPQGSFAKGKLVSVVISQPERNHDFSSDEVFPK